MSEDTRWSFRRSLTKLGVLTSHATAITIVVAYGLLWWVFAPETLEWHAGATLATWFMTFLIQRATHRDNPALPSNKSRLGDSNVHAKAQRNTSRNACLQHRGRMPPLHRRRPFRLQWRRFNGNADCQAAIILPVIAFRASSLPITRGSIPANAVCGSCQYVNEKRKSRLTLRLGRLN